MDQRSSLHPRLSRPSKFPVGRHFRTSVSASTPDLSIFLLGALIEYNRLVHWLQTIIVSIHDVSQQFTVITVLLSVLKYGSLKVQGLSTGLNVWPRQSVPIPRHPILRMGSSLPGGGRSCATTEGSTLGGHRDGFQGPRRVPALRTHRGRFA